MDAVTLSELRKPRPYPAVSVLMPTHRSARENREDRIRLRNLLAEVRHRLRDDPRVAPDAADHVLRGLERAAEEVDPRHGSDGLVLFAAPNGEHHAFTIGQPVDERVVVDTGFATRDLVADFTRRPRYWLLSLSDHRTRLWDGLGGDLTEHVRGGFPLAPAPIDEASAGRLARRAAQGGDGERRRQAVRDAVAAVERVLARDRRPLIVAGVTRHQALFDEIAGPHVTVAGRVEGGFEGAPPSVLAEATARRSPPTRTSARSACCRSWRPRAASSATRAGSARWPAWSRRDAASTWSSSAATTRPPCGPRASSSRWRACPASSRARTWSTTPWTT